MMLIDVKMKKVDLIPLNPWKIWKIERRSIDMK